MMWELSVCGRGSGPAADELPILGPVDGCEGYLNATGHFRTGILNAPITAEMLTAVMVSEAPPVPIEPFLLSRFDKTDIPMPTVQRNTLKQS